ncbi:hypothetical protein JL720_15746 [Aureococcus anophagefferens]|nr:hypothetical protein JL720_15746 [Aureococcus anophagefferens]
MLFLLLILQIINAKLDRSKIMRELNRSVYAYDGVDATDPARYLRDYLWVKSSTVMILDGVVVVDKHFIHYAATQEKIDKHLAFVTSVAAELPNAVYQFSDDSTGVCHAGDPCLVIAKSHAARDGVMIPNPYFANVDDWRDFRAVLQRAANARPWEHRRKRAFWRGSISPHDDKNHREADCLKNLGSFARLAAAAQTLAAPHEVDVKCLSHAPPLPCALRKDPHFCDGVAGAPPQNYTAAIAAAVRHPEKITAKAPSDQVDYAAYRFLLNLPGSTHGSYSWNLNHLWSLGSVVLQWDMDAVEFYYPALEDGATHVVVDAETLAPTVKALQGDAARAKALRDGAREVHREVTCPECLAGYFGDVLRAIRERSYALASSVHVHEDEEEHFDLHDADDALDDVREDGDDDDRGGGCVWHAQIVRDDFADPKHCDAAGALKPRRPLPQIRAGAFFAGDGALACFPGRAMVAAANDARATRCHLFAHRYSKARESAKDVLTYHAAVLLEWDDGTATVCELAWLHGLGGYGGRCNWLPAAPPGEATELIGAMPAAMQAPWRSELCEVQHSGDVRLAFRTKKHIFAMILNYQMRDAAYHEESRNCQTFAADLYGFAAGKKGIEPDSQVCRVLYKPRPHLFLYDPDQYA